MAADLLYGHPHRRPLFLRPFERCPSGPTSSCVGTPTPCRPLRGLQERHGSLLPFKDNAGRIALQAPTPAASITTSTFPASRETSGGGGNEPFRQDAASDAEYDDACTGAEQTGRQAVAAATTTAGPLR